MDIKVVFYWKVYKYVELGRITTWVDSSNLTVPVFLHSKLREQALKDGFDESNFLSEKQELKALPEEVLVKKVRSKNSTVVAFNPFK